MSLHLFGCRLCLHIKRIWDGEEYRPTFVARTRKAELRIRLWAPRVSTRRF
jgi:hypothetical protein